MFRTDTLRRRSLNATITLAASLLAACSVTDPVDGQSADIPSAEAQLAAAEAQGLVRVTFPDPDPGVPLYARLGNPANQIFHNERWLVVPFYRNPDQVPANFNLLELYAFPGPTGPGAFGATLLITGQYMIERGAPLGTFPKVAVSTGTAVPVWFVDWSTFRSAMADNVVTMGELRAMNPLRGVATRFSETLRPRIGDHLLVLSAAGTLTDGRRFDVQVTHVESTTRNLRIDIR
jgi:hypothetical protein